MINTNISQDNPNPNTNTLKPMDYQYQPEFKMVFDPARPPELRVGGSSGMWRTWSEVDRYFQASKIESTGRAPIWGRTNLHVELDPSFQTDNYIINFGGHKLVEFRRGEEHHGLIYFWTPIWNDSSCTSWGIMDVYQSILGLRTSHDSTKGFLGEYRYRFVSGGVINLQEPHISNADWMDAGRALETGLYQHPYSKHVSPTRFEIPLSMIDRTKPLVLNTNRSTLTWESILNIPSDIRAMYQAPDADTSREFKQAWVPLKEQIKFSIAMGAWYEDFRSRSKAAGESYGCYARPPSHGIGTGNETRRFNKWSCDEKKALEALRNDIILGVSSETPDSLIQEAFCHVVKGKNLGPIDNSEYVNKTLNSSVETFRKKLQISFADQIAGNITKGGYILDTSGNNPTWWTNPLDLGKVVTK